MIRVGVIGAAGRMGRMVCVAVSADPDLDLVVGIVRPGTELAPDLSDLPLSDSMEALRESGAEVAVDFTRPDAVMGNLRWAIANGIHMVVGTTGLSPDDLDEVERLLTQREGGSNVVVAPNFAIGAVLMQRFAEQAARFFPSAEIVELHHEGKLDALLAVKAVGSRPGLTVGLEPILGLSPLDPKP